MSNDTSREMLIEKLRWAVVVGGNNTCIQAVDMLEADGRVQQVAVPVYGWLTACDEEMINYGIGVANLSDSYSSAKVKLRALMDLHVAVATDPAVNGGLSLQPVVKGAKP